LRITSAVILNPIECISTRHTFPAKLSNDNGTANAGIFFGTFLMIITTAILVDGVQKLLAQGKNEDIQRISVDK
jgi:hypothetical protein